MKRIGLMYSKETAKEAIPFQIMNRIGDNDIITADVKSSYVLPLIGIACYGQGKYQQEKKKFQFINES